METLLISVVVLMLVALLVATLTLLLGLRSLKKRNRVSPDRPTEAPLTWLYSPVSPARLHRRLRSAVSVARMIQARHAGDRLPVPHVAMAAELEGQAVALDQHLTMIGRVAPAERRRLAGHLTAEVVKIEQLASRLSLIDADASASARLPHQPTEVQELADRLDQLEAARREVAAEEAHHGLVSPSVLPPAPAPDHDPRLRRGRG